jgi:hypothetical protein
MSGIGQILPTPQGFGQVPAEKAGTLAGLFRDSANRAKQHSASGYFSRKPLAERQNRYPSPLQGPDLIPVWSLYIFATSLLGRIGIALRSFLADFGGINAAEGDGVCVEKSRLSPVSVCWALRAAATRFWNRHCLARAQVPWAQLLSAGTQQRVPQSAWLATYSVSISATAADVIGGLTTSQNAYPGHSRTSCAGGLFFARSHPDRGSRAFMGTE